MPSRPALETAALPPPPAGRPLLVGLTGGIGSGKSEALAAFARHGAATLSSDAVVHELYLRPDVKEAVAARFGAEVLGPDGEVDRSRLGEAAFAEPDGLRFLERLLHPLVEEAFVRCTAAAAGRGDALVVHEVPLLFEAGLESRYDLVVLVTAPDEVRRGRAGQRFDQRSASQLPAAAKRARAGVVYVNDGSLDELDGWVAALVGRLSPA
jgi:dephospho-CoA kinase